MHTFKHPKYYKELRRAGVQVNSSRPAHSRCNKSDQAISLRAHDGECERASDPGHKQQASSYKLPGPRPISNANKGLIHKRQASSLKHQAQQERGHKPQAPSPKQQASSFKHQASSFKQQASSTKRFKSPGAGFITRATSIKLQAPSNKLPDS